MTLFLATLLLKSAGICLLGLLFLAVLRNRESSLKRATLWASGGLLLLSPLFFFRLPSMSVTAPNWLAANPAPAAATQTKSVQAVETRVPADASVGSSDLGAPQENAVVAQIEDAGPAPSNAADKMAGITGVTQPHPSTPGLPNWTWLWIGGTAALLVRVLIGFFGARQLIVRTAPCSGEALKLLTLLRVQLGVRKKVRLLVGGSFGPAAIGVLRPAILLPKDYESWPIERLQAVLAHELSHIRQWDLLLAGMLVVGRALFWPNPLAWVLAAKGRWLIEESADDFVLQNGFFAPDYAAELLSLARGHHGTRTFALTMASGPALEKRIKRVLDSSVSRRRPKPLVRALVFAGIAMLALPCLGLSATAAQETPAAPAAGAAAPAPPRLAQGRAIRRLHKHGRASRAIGRAPQPARPSKNALRRLPRMNTPFAAVGATPETPQPFEGPGAFPRPARAPQTRGRRLGVLPEPGFAASAQPAAPPAIAGGASTPSGAAPQAGASPFEVPTAPGAPAGQPFVSSGAATMPAPPAQGNAAPRSGTPALPPGSGAYAGPMPQEGSGLSTAPAARGGAFPRQRPPGDPNQASTPGVSYGVAVPAPPYATTPAPSAGFGSTARATRLGTPGAALPATSQPYPPSASYRRLKGYSSAAPVAQYASTSYQTGFTPPPGSRFRAIGKDKNGKSVYYWVEARPTKSGRAEYYVYTGRDKRFKLKYTSKGRGKGHYRVTARGRKPSPHP